MTIYIEVAEAIELHREVIDRTGAIYQGIRSPNDLESALARPQMAAYDEGEDLIRQATLLAVGISQNQPFVDGNKRAGFAVAVTCLDVNGYQYDGAPIEFARQVEAVAERTGSLDAATDRFDAWLRANTAPRTPEP